MDLIRQPAAYMSFYNYLNSCQFSLDVGCGGMAWLCFFSPIINTPLPAIRFLEQLIDARFARTKDGRAGNEGDLFFCTIAPCAIAYARTSLVLLLIQG